MFLRRCVRRKSGKRHTYWALVGSYRRGRGSRQRLVAYLGELRRSEQNGWAPLGRKLSGKHRPQRSLFDPPHYDDPADEEEEPVLVRLKGVALERLRDFGDVWLACGLWRLLGLDKLLDGLIPPGREEVSWATVAAILTVARFCKPQSELHIEDTWSRISRGRVPPIPWPSGDTRATDDRNVCRCASVWWSRRRGFPWVTRSFRATVMMPRPWKTSSWRWRRNTAGRDGCG